MGESQWVALGSPTSLDCKARLLQFVPVDSKVDSKFIDLEKRVVFLEKIFTPKVMGAIVQALK